MFRNTVKCQGCNAPRREWEFSIGALTLEIHYWRHRYHISPQRQARAIWSIKIEWDRP